MEKTPDFGKMTDAEHRAYQEARREESGPPRLYSQEEIKAYQKGVPLPEPPNTGAERVRQIQAQSSNPAYTALVAFTVVGSIAGLIMIIAGAANLNVETFGEGPSDPGLPWLIIGSGLLNVAFVSGIALLIVNATVRRITQEVV